MILNKKGVESFPFFLFLTLLIASFVLTIGFYQVETFSKFSSQQEIADSYNALKNAMENLRDAAAEDSFTRIKFKVPPGYKVTFNVEDDIIKVEGPEGLSLENNPGFDITYLTFDKELKPGTYELVVYYGGHTNENDQPYAIYFK